MLNQKTHLKRAVCGNHQSNTTPNNGLFDPLSMGLLKHR